MFRFRRLAADLADRVIDARRIAQIARARDVRAVVMNYHVMRAQSMRAHLDALDELFDVVPLDELLRRAERPLASGARVPTAITVDDGKCTHLTEIAAVLSERQRHGTFFVTAGLSASGGVHWFDLADRARRAFDAELARPEPSAAVRALRSRYGGILRERRRRGAPPVVEVEFERLKRMDAARRDEIVAALVFGLEVDPSPIDDDERPLTPEQVAELARRGFTVGSHSSTHAILTCESADRVWHEVADSQAEIAEWIGQPVLHFCYPNGNHSAATEAATRRAGYTTAWVTDPVWLGARENLHRLPRVQIFESFDRAEIALKVVLALFGGLPNPDGTGRAYRQTRAVQRVA